MLKPWTSSCIDRRGRPATKLDPAANPRRTGTTCSSPGVLARGTANAVPFKYIASDDAVSKQNTFPTLPFGQLESHRLQRHHSASKGTTPPPPCKPSFPSDCFPSRYLTSPSPHPLFAHEPQHYKSHARERRTHNRTPAPPKLLARKPLECGAPTTSFLCF